MSFSTERPNNSSDHCKLTKDARTQFRKVMAILRIEKGKIGNTQKQDKEE